MHTTALYMTKSVIIVVTKTISPPSVGSLTDSKETTTTGKTPILHRTGGDAQEPIPAVTVAPNQAAETEKTTVGEAGKVATPEMIYTHSDLQAADKEALHPTKLKSRQHHPHKSPAKLQRIHTYHRL